MLHDAEDVANPVAYPEKLNQRFAKRQGYGNRQATGKKQTWTSPLKVTKKTAGPVEREIVVTAERRHAGTNGA